MISISRFPLLSQRLNCISPRYGEANPCREIIWPLPRPSMKLIEVNSSDVCCLKFELDQLLHFAFAEGQYWIQFSSHKILIVSSSMSLTYLDELSPLILLSPSLTLLPCLTRWRASNGATSSLLCTLKDVTCFFRNPNLFFVPECSRAPDKVGQIRESEFGGSEISFLPPPQLASAHRDQAI